MARAFHYADRLELLFIVPENLQLKDVFGLSYYPEPRQNEYIMHFVDRTDRVKFFGVLDERIDAARQTVRSAVALYAEVRVEFIEQFLENERIIHYPTQVIERPFLTSNHYPLSQHAIMDQRLALDSRWLEALASWKQYLNELLGSLKTMRVIQRKIWDITEQYRRAEDVDDEPLVQSDLNALREELAVAERRQTWAVAECETWKRGLLGIMNITSEFTVVGGPSASRWIAHD